MARKIKVLILTHSFPTEFNKIGGIFLLNQLKELKKYCDIRIIFPHGYVPKFKFLNPYYRFSKIPDFEKVEGIEVYHPKYFMVPRAFFRLIFLNIYLSMESFFSYLSSRKSAKKLMENWNPDIVHMHGSLSEMHLGLSLKEKYAKPLVVTVYGEDVTKYLKKAVSGGMIKKSLRSADAIISQSNFLKKEIESSGVKGKRFFIIPMGANFSMFRPRDKLNARKNLGLPAEKKIILFVGHLVERKGVNCLIESLKDVVNKYPDVLCCIVGSGAMEKSLKEMASSFRLDNNVRFVGSKTNDEVAFYMNACDMLVLPSLNEGLPVVVYEAMASAKPVVATRVAGTPEILNEKVGYLVEPKDPKGLSGKILLALGRKWNKNDLTIRAKEFSTINTAKKVAQVYRMFLK
jgi:teichuronic acid biosynthesis glycosyltransferase TuaC